MTHWSAPFAATATCPYQSVTSVCRRTAVEEEKIMSKYTCPEYEQLKKNLMRGWKTWNVNSVFSFVHMPDGLSVNLSIKEYRNGCFLQDALIGRFPADDWEDATEVLSPVDHAMDDSYTAVHMTWCDTQMLIESACEEDTLCLKVTPVKFQIRPVCVAIHAGCLWNRPGSVEKENGSLLAESSDGARYVITCSRKEEQVDLQIPLIGQYLGIPLDETLYIFVQRVSEAQTSAVRMPDVKTSDVQASAVRIPDVKTPDAQASAAQPSSSDSIARAAEEFLSDKKQRLAAHYASYGALGWMVQAMECALSYDTIYDPAHNRVISPVSRLWSIRKGGYVLFCWDNLFAGYLAMEGSKALAYSNVIEIINEQTDRGFVPNMSCGNGLKTLDRSQPPVGSSVVLALYRRYQDRWLAELLYPALFAWNTWFYENRTNPSGTLSWGSDPSPVRLGNRWETDGVYDRFGASLESGLDNSPMYDDIPFDKETHLLLLEDVGLTGLFIRDTAALAELAGIVGRQQDTAVLQQRKKRAEAGLEGLWDEENGFYYNKRIDTGAYSRRISPTNFYALFSDAVPKERLERILKEHYYNPEEFYGDWMLPSIARNDPAYPDQDYWRGRVWAPMNFLTYLAFEKQGLTQACRDLAGKSLRIFEPEWKEHRHVHENYNAMTGEGCDVPNSDKFYHWGALLTVIALRSQM